MTALIAIDEAGDLGSAGTRFFSIAAIIVFRSRDLKKAASLLPSNSERKWHNTIPEKRKELFSVMSDLKFSVVYAVVEKNRPQDHEFVYGNPLYKKMLRIVLSDAMRNVSCRDVDVFLDRNSFITNEEFRNLVFEGASESGVNPLRVKTLSSDQNKCIQLADFVAGASRAKYEHDDCTLDIIKEKVSLARRL